MPLAAVLVISMVVSLILLLQRRNRQELPQKGSLDEETNDHQSNTFDGIQLTKRDQSIDVYEEIDKQGSTEVSSTYQNCGGNVHLSESNNTYESAENFAKDHIYQGL